jgi:hypothetical protein
MLRILIPAALTLVPASAFAQDGTPPQRIRSVEIRAGESCPKPTSDTEVVVCRTISEPYRIPKELREQPKTDAPGTSWAVKADRMMEDNQKVLPGSCSTIGLNGQSGCAQQAAERWAAERRAQQSNGAQPLTPDR